MAKKPLRNKQAVVKRLRKIEKLNFLESFAMFMGKAQIVEFGLKELFVRQYGYDSERIEKWISGERLENCASAACEKISYGWLKN